MTDKIEPPSSPAPAAQLENSLVLAAEAYALKCVEATGRKFDISALVELKAWFYAGARWRATRPDADVIGPQSDTMSPAPAAETPLTFARKMVERLWNEIPLHRRAQMMSEGWSIDQLIVLEREASPVPADPAAETPEQLVSDLRFFADGIDLRAHRTPWETGVSKLLRKAAEAIEAGESR